MFKIRNKEEADIFGTKEWFVLKLKTIKKIFRANVLERNPIERIEESLGQAGAGGGGLCEPQADSGAGPEDGDPHLLGGELRGGARVLFRVVSDIPIILKIGITNQLDSNKPGQKRKIGVEAGTSKAAINTDFSREGQTLYEYEDNVTTITLEAGHPEKIDLDSCESTNMTIQFLDRSTGRLLGSKVTKHNQSWIVFQGKVLNGKPRRSIHGWGNNPWITENGVVLKTETEI